MRGEIIDAEETEEYRTLLNLSNDFPKQYIPCFKIKEVLGFFRKERI